MIHHYGWLAPLGFIIGTCGTLVGAGGGFVLVPLLLLLYPKESPETITSISLAVVFFNTASGSFAYSRMKRIDYRSGALFSLATIPGAVLGALSTAYISRRVFDLTFGILMTMVSIYLMIHPRAAGETQTTNPESGQLERSAFYSTRSLVDADGTHYSFSFNPTIGVGLSLLVGYLSSLLGVGGGFIHVLALVHLLNFPVHVATATSHFVLAIMALTATLAHIAAGSFMRGVRRTLALAIGVVVGAQLGAVLSNRVHGDWIIRGLAAALAFVGLRILILGVS